MTSVAMLSMHTSPLAQPGVGDGGGMNVYVRELAASLAQAGVPTTVFVRRWADSLPDRVMIEPLLEVVHVDAGPADLPKEALPDMVDSFADGVRRHLLEFGAPSVIHANYWLSAVAGHRLKHELEVPLVSTFHTLARVKAVSGDAEPRRRVEAETSVIGCSDAICASNPVEAQQLIDLYGAVGDRIEIVPPGVDHAFFSPGDQRGARKALGLGDEPVLLFVGRIQSLKGLDLAVAALAALGDRRAKLVVVGGPSGSDGESELRRIHTLIDDLDLTERVRFVDPQPHHLLSTYYRAADVCVVPSRSESFGLVALEAAACGTPVVAAAVGGLTTLVDDGLSGYLIDGRTPDEWAAAIGLVLGDRELASTMSKAAAELGRGYAWSTTAGRLRRLYSDLSSTRRLVECGGAPA